jgi:hypothetical protein
MSDERLEIRATMDAGQLQQGAAQATEAITRVRMSAEQFNELVARAGSTSAAALGRAFMQMESGANQAAAAAQTTTAATRQLGEAASEASSGTDRLKLSTAGTTREFIVLGHEVMTGNFSRIPGSIVVLLERMGSLQSVVESINPVFAAAAAGAGALAIALGYVAAQAIHAENALRGLYNARLLVGGGGAANMEQMARAGATALTGTGMMNQREATDYTVAVGKMGELSSESSKRLMSLGAALTVVKGSASEARSKPTRSLSVPKTLTPSKRWRSVP